MSTAKNKNMETRKKLKEQKEKDELKLKAIQLRLKKATQKIIETEKKEEADREIIAGEFVIEKVKKDSSFKIWFDGEINTYIKNDKGSAIFNGASLDRPSDEKKEPSGRRKWRIKFMNSFC